MFCALSRVAWSLPASFDSASASLREATAPGPLPSPAALAQAVDRTLQRLHILLIGGRRIDQVGIERGPDHLRRLRDQLQLCRLILRHKTVDRHHAQDFRQLFQPRLDLLRFRFRSGQHVDGVGAGVGVLAQIEEGRDRFSLRIAQVDRVEVELHEIEQRQAGHDEEQRADDDDDAMLFEEFVHRRQERVTDRLAFAGRVKQLQHGRQRRDAGDERDQHAGAGDLAEFGNALVVGRQETQEAGGGRHRGERKRHRRTSGRALQRQRQIFVLETLGTVADAELDAEIDAEADEQHGKGDRQQVQRSHHHQADRGRQRKADEQVHEHREDDLRRNAAPSRESPAR